jgi:two-component system response regulator ArlR
MPGTEDRKSIVIVEDERLYGRILDYQLGNLGYDCRLINSGHAFLEYLAEGIMPDLFIFDYFLGHDEPTGLTLCRRVRSMSDIPVIILTGNNKLETLVSCLKAGADHYIVKPCDIRELEARIVSSLRKSLNIMQPGQKSVMDQRLDDNILMKWQEQLIVSPDGRQQRLTEKEFGLLELFVSSAERYVDRESAFQVLYGYDMQPNNRSIDVLISKLRKKLNELEPAYRIKPMRGKGYLLFKSDEAA